MVAEVCDNCTTVPADSHCIECDENFCGECFTSLHKTQKKKLHQKSSLTASSASKAPSSAQCDNCEHQQATTHCNDCEESFCHSCAVEQHKSAKKKRHQVVNLSDGKPVVIGDDDLVSSRSSIESIGSPAVVAHVHGPNCDHGHDHDHAGHSHASHSHAAAAPSHSASNAGHVHGPNCNHDHNGHDHGEQHLSHGRVSSSTGLNRIETFDRTKYGVSSEAEEAQALQQELENEIWTDLSAFNLPLAMKEAQIWVEKVTDEQFPDPDFKESLKSGRLLCKLVNIIKPGSVVKTHTMTAMFACMENISFFLGACRQLGLEDSQLFESIDLYEGRKIPGVVITLYWLARAARGLGFKGPHLNLT